MLSTPFWGTGKKFAEGSLSLVKLSVVSRLGTLVVSLRAAERGMCIIWMEHQRPTPQRVHRDIWGLWGKALVAMGLQGWLL